MLTWPCIAHLIIHAICVRSNLVLKRYFIYFHIRSYARLLWQPSWIFDHYKNDDIVRDHPMIIHVQLGIDQKSSFWEKLFIHFYIVSYMYAKVCPMVTAILELQSTKNTFYMALVGLKMWFDLFIVTEAMLDDWHYYQTHFWKKTSSGWFRPILVEIGTRDFRGQDICNSSGKMTFIFLMLSTILTSFLNPSHHRLQI